MLDPMLSAVFKLISTYHPKNKMRSREVSDLPKVTGVHKGKAGMWFQSPHFLIPYQSFAKQCTFKEQFHSQHFYKSDELGLNKKTGM